MSEASRSWPDYGQVIEDNLAESEKQGQPAGEDPGPAPGEDSDEERVERARRRHEELGAADEGGVNSEPLAVPEETPGAEVNAAPAADERATAESKDEGGEYGKSVAPPAE